MYTQYEIDIKRRGELIIDPARVSNIDNVETGRKALHEYIEIKCFYEGTSTLLIGSQTVNAEAGDIVVINPYEFHVTAACGKQKGRYHLFMVSLDYFKDSKLPELDLRTLFFARQEHFKTLLRGNKRLFNILMRAAEEYEQGAPFSDVAIKGLITEFFAVLMRTAIVKTPDVALNKNMLHSYNLIEPAVRYIRDNYSKQISVESLSELCGVSKHYFCRVFKNVTGKTVMEYLKDYRLAVSDTVLRNTDKSVNEVAELCGFESANYFCRCYKKAFGITPGKKRTKE